MSESIPGEVIERTMTYKDAQGTLIDPTSITVEVKNEAGAVVSSGSATRESTGVYFYQWDTDPTTPEGLYTWKWTATIGGQTFDNKSFIRLAVPRFPTVYVP